MTEKEIAELRGIVHRYSEIDGELEGIMKKMEEFKKRHDELLTELGELADRENSFISAIREKYGNVDYNEFLKYITDISPNKKDTEYEKGI